MAAAASPERGEQELDFLDGRGLQVDGALMVGIVPHFALSGFRNPSSFCKTDDSSNEPSGKCF